MSWSPSFPLSFALVAAGNVGLAVSRLLVDSNNEPVAVWSRSQTSADRAAEVLNTEIAPLEEVAAGADLVLVGAPESAIHEIVSRAAGSLHPRSVVIHFAGSAGPSLLAPAEKAGARTLALHPVQACPDVAAAMRRLPGSAWGVTCNEGDRAWAHELVSQHLQGVPVDVSEENRAAWHAAAATTANGVTAVLASAQSILESIGISDPQAVLTPLAHGAVANAAEERGGSTTLTGPIVRGETETVARHLQTLMALDPDLADLYRQVAQVILGWARRIGRADQERLDEIATTLDHS